MRNPDNQKHSVIACNVDVLRVYKPFNVRRNRTVQGRSVLAKPHPEVPWRVNTCSNLTFTTYSGLLSCAERTVSDMQ
jgi:hypothetical protein